MMLLGTPKKERRNKVSKVWLLNELCPKTACRREVQSASWFVPFLGVVVIVQLCSPIL